MDPMIELGRQPLNAFSKTNTLAYIYIYIYVYIYIYEMKWLALSAY